MMTKALLWVALLLALTHHITSAHQSKRNAYTESSTMGGSLLVNQLAILRMLDESSNSCSAVPPNFLEKLQAQLEQDKHEFHTTITDFLVQMEALKNDTITDVQRMSEVKGAINDTRENVITVEEKVVEIQTRLDFTQTQLDDTSTHLHDMQFHLDDTKTRLDDTQILLNMTQSNLNYTQTHLNGTQTQLDDSNALLNDIQERVSVMASVMENTQANLRISQAKLQQLQDGQDEINKELGNLSGINEKVTSARNSINTLSTRINAMEDQVHLTSQAVTDVSSRDILSLCSGTKVLRGLTGAVTVVASGQYPDNTDCTWEVEVQSGSMILLTWIYFDTEVHGECAYDYVQLHDKAHQEQLYGKSLCGSVTPDALLVNSHHLNIKFHSDGSNQYKGFLLRYFTFLDDSSTTVS